ncbi:hypothetical protein JRQ81_014542 [Phrynocephalus forsythii]|uniref:HAT C-terminal dimerisation domain-containing protein n=1 Tax=Phrynocephalus forsythii TaxID=171643 RepID=A0A9Q0XXJ4_9SAUR|nr:hypothetical protein JRQ81_014542 [Phrynocephalus forsythii]
MDEAIQIPCPTSPFLDTPTLYQEEDKGSESEMASESESGSLHLNMPDSEDLLAGTDLRQAPGSDGRSSPLSTQSTTSDSSSTLLSRQGTGHTTTTAAAAGNTRGGGTFYKPHGCLWEHFENSPEDARMAVCKKCGVVVRRGNEYPGRSQSSPKEQGLGRQAADRRGYPPWPTKEGKGVPDGMPVRSSRQGFPGRQCCRPELLEDRAMTSSQALSNQGQAFLRAHGSQSDAEEGSSQGSSSFCTPGVYTQRPGSVPAANYLASALAMAVSSAVEAREEEEPDPALTMVKEHMAEPLQPLTLDPLHYWARKADLWPTLSTLALDLLSIPPTSVQSECVFSHMGDVLRPHRSQLDPETVERLTFIRFNLSTLGLPQHSKT